MKCLLLSAYDAPSHRYWREGLVAHCSRHQWTQLVLPPRHFRWRIRGNGLYWAMAERQTLQRPYDLMVATSMVDLATLKGLVPSLARVPALVYFHENQFAYPLSGGQHQSLDPAMVNLYSALAADRVLFNSAWNRDSFLDGVATLLRRLPDAVPDGVLQRLTDCSSVLPVPLRDRVFADHQTTGDDRLQLVWNHRWEYDKGPERLLSLVQALPAELPLRWHIVGQQFRREPPAFAQLKSLLHSRGWLGEWGYQKRPEDYLAILRRADIAVSTALHDFQGLAVLEAVAAGAVPLVPDRLAYREWFSQRYRYPSYPEDADREVLAAAQTLQHMIAMRPPVPDVKGFRWQALGDQYQTVFGSLATTGDVR